MNRDPRDGYFANAAGQFIAINLKQNKSIRTKRLEALTKMVNKHIICM